MGLRRIIAVLPLLTGLFSFCAASPYSPSKASLQHGRRDETSPADSSASAFPSCHVGTKLPCPGFYPTTADSCVGKPVDDAIQDLSYLAHAALRALHNPDSINQPPSTPYANASIDPAAHYFYFFENDRKTAEFVADVFSSIAACADRHDCPFNVIFCGESPWPGACESPPGRYGFVRDPNQYGAQLNNRPRTGLPFWLCDAGLELPRNPIPCSTPGGLPSLGYALLQQIVQADIITRPDVSFLQQKAKQDNITDFHNGSPWTLKELAFLTNAEVKGRSVANAENYARFASWSWDLGFGGSPWTGETCQERFAQVVNQQTLIRLGRSVLETGGNFGGT